MSLKSLSWQLRFWLSALLLMLAVPAQGEPGAIIGTVWRIQGQVEAVPKNAAPARQLSAGMPIHAGETIRASALGEALLRMQDAGLIAVRPNTEFVVERFAARGNNSDHQLLRLLTGSVRIVTGWIGKLNRAEHKVVTPQATIGIRGTDHEPYVLSAQQASGRNLPGTYNKVNSGSTLLAVDENELAIDPGKVGFVRDAGSMMRQDGKRTRALLTLLLPILLDRVPDFYVPGTFEDEIDHYAAEAGQHADEALSKLAAAPETPNAAVCDSEKIATRWIEQFDQALTERNAEKLIGMLAPDVTARATIRTREQQTRTLEFQREEIVSSTLQAIQSLSDYSHRRLSLTVRGSNEACDRIRLRSLVIEQGQLSGKAYRFDSIEEFELQQINGRWLAIRMETTQR